MADRRPLVHVTGNIKELPAADRINGSLLTDASVTNAKLANMAASRIKARKTASTGDPEDCTLSEVLDFIGSAAQGDMLYRGASGWARLAAGASGHFLQTQGAGANPQWASAAGAGAPWSLAGSWTYSTNVASVDLTGLAGANEILVVARLITLSSSGFRSVWLSVDNGSSFYTASGDYVTAASDGTETNTTSAGSHGTAATAARTTIVHIQNAGLGGAIKRCLSNGFDRLFVASTSPVNAVRVGATAGNMTAGSAYVFTR